MTPDVREVEHRVDDVGRAGRASDSQPGRCAARDDGGLDSVIAVALANLHEPLMALDATPTEDRKSPHIAGTG